MTEPGASSALERWLLVAALVTAPGPAFAQTPAPSPDPLAPVRSMGKPLVFKPFAGGCYGLDRSGEEARSGGAAYVGLYKDLLPSIVGVGASAEGYLGGYSGLPGLNGGVRTLPPYKEWQRRVSRWVRKVI